MEPSEVLAEEEEDFRLETREATFQAGQSEAEVVLVILDDPEPEGQEAFFVYLSDPEGGAQITDGPNQGFGAFSKIIILGTGTCGAALLLSGSVSFVGRFLFKLEVNIR